MSGSKASGKSVASVKTLKPGQDVEEMLADALVSHQYNMGFVS